MHRYTAGDVMNRQVLSVRVDLSVSELAAFFVEKQITGAPVVDRDGKLVGVVSLMDIAENRAESSSLVPERDAARWHMRTHDDGTDLGELRGLHLEEVDLCVGDIMTPTVYTVPSNTPVSRVAATMLAGRIHRLLVTEGEGVVGIVTTMDLLKLLSGDERAGA